MKPKQDIFTGEDLYSKPEEIVVNLIQIASGLEKFMPESTRTHEFRKELAEAVTAAIKAAIDARIEDEAERRLMFGIAVLSMSAYFVKDHVAVVDEDDDIPVSGSGVPS